MCVSVRSPTNACVSHTVCETWEDCTDLGLWSLGWASLSRYKVALKGCILLLKDILLLSQQSKNSIRGKGGTFWTAATPSDFQYVAASFFQTGLVHSLPPIMAAYSGSVDMWHPRYLFEHWHRLSGVHPQLDPGEWRVTFGNKFLCVCSDIIDTAELMSISTGKGVLLICSYMFMNQLIWHTNESSFVLSES